MAFNPQLAIKPEGREQICLAIVWGLRGVRERADRIGARLDLWSEPGQGTEVQLLVPASIAYESFRDSYRAKLVRKVKSHAQRS